MSDKKKWKKIKKGDRVELAGGVWTVAKIKPKGKRLRVEVHSGAREARSLVKPDERVTMAADRPTKRTRPVERAKAKRPPATPPREADGDPWETPTDRIERKLDEILAARLIAETDDEAAGYYVPPVDVSTIASHLMMFHAVNPANIGDEADMMAAHTKEHADALDGKRTLSVNHWHTKRRPSAA